MGVVYAAHQSSIASTVAVKMLKKSPKIRDEQRDKFISEAVVTGELDHPNIVPIYDLGSNDEGALFYSMKRVRGTPWDKVIHQKSLDENVGILMRVADAVAFAHAGGVIHRDLKPENVMLGDYGEVLVMDWGLARVTPEFAHVDAVYQADSLGGTPAYMAPEMAKGPVESINKTSDVYLLGAILYEIIGGQPPHSGRDVMQCLLAASQNRIDPIRYDGELKAIALKAMATQQEDRYQTVKELQEAIRVYQSHSERLVLTAHANQNLQKARTAKDYQLFARALYGFQEALALWEHNHRARLLLTETQRDYATYALGIKNCFTVNVEYYTGIDERRELPVLLPPVPEPVGLDDLSVLVVDDVADTGHTLAAIHELCTGHVAQVRTAVLYEKPQSVIHPEYVWRRTEQWIAFPWSADGPVPGARPDDTGG